MSNKTTCPVCGVTRYGPHGEYCSDICEIEGLGKEVTTLRAKVCELESEVEEFTSNNSWYAAHMKMLELRVKELIKDGE